MTDLCSSTENLCEEIRILNVAEVINDYNFSKEVIIIKDKEANEEGDMISMTVNHQNDMDKGNCSIGKDSSLNEIIDKKDEERYTEKDEERYTEKDEERYTEKDEERYTEKDKERYTENDEERYTEKDEERYTERNKERYTENDEERYTEKDEERYTENDEERHTEKDEEVVVSPLVIDQEYELFRDDERGVYYRRFCCEDDLQPVIDLITKDLSEPYSIYTYRYFIYNWPRMCIMAFTLEGQCIGAIVGKTERYQNKLRGYIAMLAVQDGHRRKNIGSRLVELVIDTMIEEGRIETVGCSEVVLETEITNLSALRLYEKLGFVRDKRLFRYYLNGVDAFRLKLWLP